MKIKIILLAILGFIVAAFGFANNTYWAIGTWQYILTLALAILGSFLLFYSGRLSLNRNKETKKVKQMVEIEFEGKKVKTLRILTVGGPNWFIEAILEDGTKLQTWPCKVTLQINRNKEMQK